MAEEEMMNRHVSQLPEENPKKKQRLEPLDDEERSLEEEASERREERPERLSQSVVRDEWAEGTAQHQSTSFTSPGSTCFTVQEINRLVENAREGAAMQLGEASWEVAVKASLKFLGAEPAEDLTVAQAGHGILGALEALDVYATCRPLSIRSSRSLFPLPALKPSESLGRRGSWLSSLVIGLNSHQG